MRSSLAIFLLLLCCPPLKAQPKYSLEATFWHNQVSTRDSIYRQNFDLAEHQGSIPLHLSDSDFRFLDSVAAAVDLWGLPDTIRYHQLESIGGAVFGEATLPQSERSEFDFRTPARHKHVIVESWPADSKLRLRLQNFEMAISWVIQRQPYYNTLRVYDIKR